MAEGDLKESLNKISNSLISMHVSNLFNKYNISRENNKLRELSNTEKSQIKDAVNDLRKQSEAFLADPQNQNNNGVSSAPQDLLQKLQQKTNKNANQ
ncbi:hypothetical protein NC797_08915 [Aquibacillus sp. 3ASR75-11]|uniref:Spore coat protein W n=1 Tax=Terrihalobacillus insolitus TaxID=2950438 RepID=A0A9X4AMA2_9BACI|nr:hypothetical protein [Terrihalobacillus insolitus]MDC3413614.1 hypothetical protein [Terrihalobacillus insolitus]MDC3424629.1 hypothetical protein [Terrihalobacillus insolitus]